MRRINQPSKFFFIILIVVALLGLGVGAVYAASSLTDFEAEGFTPSVSVHNHKPDGTEANPPIGNRNNCVQAWSVPKGTTDEEIVDVGGDHGKVWRLSQGAAMGRLGAQPHSANSGEISGEAGAANDAGCGSPTTDKFYAQVDFRSATGARQNDLAIAVTANSGDQRHGYVRILENGSAGFRLEFFETVEGCTFKGTRIPGKPLSYGEWHTLGIEIFFKDGLAAGTVGSSDAVGNDVVNIYVNGLLAHTGTSFESCVGAKSVDRLLFGGSDPNSSPVIADQLGGGLYFDNVLVTALCPEGNCQKPSRGKDKD